ncbi:MAG: hypothetical protein IJ824_01580, partial [Alphaproteobacteria bacterium]|nr:hypothetical protein [Alphaproteobacteria bacterium]
DQAIEVYKVIYQSEECKRKWDAQRSIKIVNKLKRKQAVGTLPDIMPKAETEGTGATIIEDDAEAPAGDPIA